MFLSVILELNANHHGAGLIWIVQIKRIIIETPEPLENKSSDWGKDKLFVLTFLLYGCCGGKKFWFKLSNRKSLVWFKKVITKTQLND